MSGNWTFMSVHGAVLLAVHRDPDASRDDIADEAGISLRWTIKVLGDLVDEGYLRRERRGRRFRYSVNRELAMRHPIMRDVDVDRLLRLLEPPMEPAEVRRAVSGQRSELADLTDRVATERERLAIVERRRQQLEQVVREVSSTLRRAARSG